MYIPKQFEITDKDEIFSFIKGVAFGQLISHVDNQLFSSHIPFLVSDDNIFLICHIAKQNPQWKDIEGQEVLVTFQGPHDYISPSWYKSPGVPTWNYQSVHIYGNAKIVTDSEKIKKIIEDLTDIYESSSNTPWVPEYKGSLLNVIVGIEIQITKIQCKYKLSQNRSVVDQKQMIKELKIKGSTKLAQAMKNGL